VLSLGSASSSSRGGRMLDRGAHSSCMGMVMGNGGSGLGSEDGSGDLATTAQSEWRVR
jgi:hypothetical protein